MKRDKRCVFGVCALVSGVVILVVLVAFGVFIKQVLQETPKENLKYKLNGNYKTDPTFMECHVPTERQTVQDEFYVYNLTNLNDTLTGGIPAWELLGQYYLLSLHSN